MRHFLPSQPIIQRPNIALVRLSQRPAIGPRGQFNQGVEMLGLGFNQLLSKGGGALVERCAQRLEYFGIGVLRRVFHQLGKRINESERIVADKVQFVP